MLLLHYLININHGPVWDHQKVNHIPCMDHSSPVGITDIKIFRFFKKTFTDIMLLPYLNFIVNHKSIYQKVDHILWIMTLSRH